MKLRKFTVLEFCGLAQIIILLCCLDFPVDSFNLLAQGRKAIHRSFFILPLGLHGGKFIVKFGKFLL